MEFNPLVSVIIITKNRPTLLRYAVESVKRQTYDNYEIIIVDDASDKDIKEENLKAFDNIDIKYIYLPVSKGGNHARNEGIKNSQGDLIAFLDDDDEWMPTKIQEQVKVIKEKPNVGVVACGKIVEYDFGYKIKYDTSRLAEGDLGMYVMTNIPYITSTLLVKKELLVQVGGFDEKLKYWQEYELEMRLFQCTLVGVVRKPLVVYRVLNSQHQQLTNNIYEWTKAVEYINDKHEKILNSLDANMRNKREIMIIKDGALRSERCHDSINKRYYLKELLNKERTIKNMIRYITNIYSFKIFFGRIFSKFFAVLRLA